MKEKIIEVCNLVISETEQDMKELDGKPFNGRTMAEAFGKQAAGTVALANLIILLAKSLP